MVQDEGGALLCLAHLLQISLFSQNCNVSLHFIECFCVTVDTLKLPGRSCAENALISDCVVQHIEIMQTVFYSATYFHLCNDSNVVLQSLNTCVFLLLPAAQSQSGGHDVRPGVSAQRQRVCRLLQGQKNVSAIQNTNTNLC